MARPDSTRFSKPPEDLARELLKSIDLLGEVPTPVVRVAATFLSPCSDRLREWCT